MVSDSISREHLFVCLDQSLLTPSCLDVGFSLCRKNDYRDSRSPEDPGDQWGVKRSAAAVNGNHYSLH